MAQNIPNRPWIFCHHWGPYLKDSQNDRESTRISPRAFSIQLVQAPRASYHKQKHHWPPQLRWWHPALYFCDTARLHQSWQTGRMNIKRSTVEPGQSCNTIFCRQRPTGNSSHSLQFSVTQHYLSGPKLSCYARLRSNWSLLLRTSFYHLRNIAKVMPFLFQKDAERLVCGFISSRLDGCNALLSGQPKKTASVNSPQRVSSPIPHYTSVKIPALASCQC